jgi:hypothetical protein
MDLKETGWEGVEWIEVTQNRFLWLALLNMVMNFYLMKVWDLLHLLSHCHLLKDVILYN